jgi:glycosyltransferase involved in cell wall biosynthesis
MSRIVIMGPAHPLRGGGLTTFNQRLANQFINEGHTCSIYSFSLQYPTFLFPGSSQFTDEQAPENLVIRSVINSVNPLNWFKVGNQLKKEKPDIIIVRYWLPFMGPALGTILRRVRKNKHTKIICIADNIIPHEKRVGDKLFTKYFVKPCHAFITMSEKVMQDLRIFEKHKPALLVPHPLYDNFGVPINKQEARQHLQLSVEDKIVLFFGFIRKYKGLDLLLEALSVIQNSKQQTPNIKLLVAGEFYEDEKPYKDLITQLGIASNVILHTHFIPDSEVKYYLCAADVVVQPYKNATQSGVTPLAYHFEIPMIVTRVGGLPALVPHGKAGLVVEPTAPSIAQGIDQFYAKGEAHFLPFLKEEKKKLSWNKLTQSILDLAKKS